MSFASVSVPHSHTDGGFDHDRSFVWARRKDPEVRNITSMNRIGQQRQTVASAIAVAVMFVFGVGIAVAAFSQLSGSSAGGHAFSGVCGVIVAVAGVIVALVALRSLRSRWR